MRALRVFALGAVGAAAMIATASAQTKSAVTASELQEVLSAAGLAPTMTEDVMTGAPVAKGQVADGPFFVRALGCSGRPPACENLVFFANFDLGRTVTQNDFRIINAFNDKQVFGRAYVLESQNKIGVDYVIELGGGVTMDHLTTNVGRWADVVGAFIDSFRAGQSSS